MIALLLPLLAHATTFGPLSVVEQARHSGYVVHGRVKGAPWVEMEPQVRRPYTYWKLEVIEQPLGTQLGAEVQMREPGGEIGDMGYHVAGSASFAADEEVFVTLRDTDEGNTKEIVGLASGKYRVEKGADGRLSLRNGLGLPVTGANGQLLSPQEFTALLQRVAQHTETEADKSVIINNQSSQTHADEQPPAAEPIHIHSSTPLPATATATASTRESPADSAQKSSPKTEESSTGSSVELWILLGAAVLGFFGLAVFLRR